MATMTWAGLDVHARSTEAAADRRRERRAARGGVSAPAPSRWSPGSRALPQPVRACYEAGPTGYGLYRAAPRGRPRRFEVIAPGKTPRARGRRASRATARTPSCLCACSSRARSRRSPCPRRGRGRPRPRARPRPAARRPHARPPPGLQAAPAPRARLRGPRLDAGSPRLARRRSASRTRRPSSPTSTAWPPSTVSSPAARRSTSGSRGSPWRSPSGRRWRACAASAASTPSPPWHCTSRSTTGDASSVPRSWPPGSA